MPEPQQKKPQPRRKRTRKPDGTFQSNEGENQAWEPTECEVALPKKENKYEVKPKVKPQSKAGKYSEKPKVRPTFGTVTTKSY